MKWPIIAVAVLGCVGQGIAHAEPVRVSLEWIELDCTKCPELAARFQRVGFAERRDAAFADLEKAAAKRFLVHHVEWIEPGAKAKHETRLGEATFDLELAIKLREPGVYEAVLNASRGHGTDVPASAKPGTQLTPAQMQGIQKVSAAFRLGLLPGQSMVVGGLPQVNNRARNNSGLKMLVLIVGLETPDETKHVSEGRSAGNLW